MATHIFKVDLCLQYKKKNTIIIISISITYFHLSLLNSQYIIYFSINQSRILLSLLVMSFHLILTALPSSSRLVLQSCIYFFCNDYLSQVHPFRSLQNMSQPLRLLSHIYDVIKFPLHAIQVLFVMSVLEYSSITYYTIYTIKYVS